MPLTRRAFLQSAAVVSAGLFGLRAFSHTLRAGEAMPTVPGYGALRADPEGILDLPEGFAYKAFSRTGEVMDDGLLVPGAHDGMATFSGPQGNTVLVRNHECNEGTREHAFGAELDGLPKVSRDRLYDYGGGESPSPGGTTTLVYDTREQKLLQHSLSLAGTIRNCAGGPTPWGSWVSCEETVVRAGSGREKDHGYCFEVPATADIGLAWPVPLKAMGRFNHEAIAIDPFSGVVYLTEDRSDGCFYRFLPEKPGDLARGGTLQVLALQGWESADTRNWPENRARITAGQKRSVYWMDCEGIDAPDDDLRHRMVAKGAALFARGEGIFYGKGEVYFACTNGGTLEKGQIFRYHPSPYEGTGRETDRPGQLELFVESTNGDLLENADNLCVAPWGDVLVCEDAGSRSSLVGITPEGRFYKIADCGLDSEMAGVCVSPDGSTVFVNIQWNPGLTLAITGPWEDKEQA